MTGYLLAVLVGVVAAAATALRRRYTLVTVHGPSMEPTLRHGDRIVVRRRRPDRIRTGDIVVALSPAATGYRPVTPVTAKPRPGRRTGSRGGLVVKRVAAVAGEPLPPSVAPVVGAPAGAPVAPGQLVVLSDNADGGRDSRHYGYLTSASVVGVARARREP